MPSFSRAKPEANPQSGPDIKVESATAGGHTIVKLDSDFESSITAYSFQTIRKPGDGEYKTTRAKFGALAATDVDKPSRAQKDRRFTMNELLRDPLSVEQEERRVIEERVRMRVSAIAEDARNQASQVGHKEGLERGHKEAYEQFRKESVDRLHQFEKLLQSAEQAKEEIFRANERFLIEIVFRISRMVLLKELSTDREYITRLAKELIDRTGVRENIILRIHPDDASTLSLLKEDIEKSMGNLTNLKVEASTQVKRGGCAVETEWNAIDASIETQLQGIYEALVGHKAEGQSQ